MAKSRNLRAAYQRKSSDDSFVDFDDPGEPRRKKPYKVSYVLSFYFLIVFILSGLVVNSGLTQPKLGLDLRGGTTILLQPELTETKKITSQSVNQAVSILRQRVDGVGVGESEIRSEGTGESTKIIVSVPGTTERDLVALVGQTAKLSIRPVLFAGVNATTPSTNSFPDDINPVLQKDYLAWNCPKEVNASRDDSSKSLIACDESGGSKFILGKTDIEGSQINDAQATLDAGSLGWTSNINFNKSGEAAFANLTTLISPLASPRNQIAIVLDGKVVMAPRVDGPITGGNVRIYGGFTQEYAKNLANVIKYGALPFSFRVDEVQQISASLGASQLKSGLASGFLGLLLISIYLCFYYRALSILAIGSLFNAFLITYGIFIVLGEKINLTLSLASIAGAIVSIGVTADSFIVYFERVRDEMRVGASLQVALRKGWNRAKRTIWIADAVSLIAAFVLYFSTTGNVRGFAFTLGLTTFIDLFIIYFFTRPTLILLGKMQFFAKGHRASGLSQLSLGITSVAKTQRKFNLSGISGRLYRGESSLGVVDRPRRWFILSGTLVLLSAISLSIAGLNLGYEFRGGSVNTVTTSDPSTKIARSALADIGYNGQATVQIVGKDKVRIETSQLSVDDASALAESLAEKFKIPIATIDSQSVGPSWGEEISKKARNGLIWFIVLLMIYLAFVLEIRMAAAALVAVIHDVFITVGLYSATGLRITPSAVIGFLTILGYSLYDTVVVFDKVRENVKQIKSKSYDEYKKAVNLALDQTLIRSLNTSIVAVIPIASILVIGAFALKAETLKDISLALVIGQTIGTYSSVFIAAPILVKLNLKKYKNESSRAVSNLIARPSIEPQSKSTRSDIEYELQSWSVKMIKPSDAPDLFRTIYEKGDSWENLWIESEIPRTLEQFSEFLKIESATLGQVNKPLIVRSLENEKILAVIEIEFDKVNKNVDIKVIALFEDHEQGIPDFLAQLIDELQTQSLSRIAIWTYDLPDRNNSLLKMPLTQEAKLVGAFRTRTGRCDALIYRYL